MDNSKSTGGLKFITAFCGFLGIMYFLSVFVMNTAINQMIFIFLAAVSLFAFMGLRKSRKYGMWSAIAVFLYAIYESLMWLWLVFIPLLSMQIRMPHFLEYYSLVILLCSIIAIVYLLREDVRNQFT